MACPRCGSTLSSGCQCSIEPSDCIDVTGSGTPTDPFIPSLIIDPDADNIAECSASGLLVINRQVLGFSGYITTAQAAMANSDVAGSAVPVVLPSNHFIEILFSIPGVRFTAATNNGWSWQIKEGVNIITENFFVETHATPTTIGNANLIAMLENPTAGAHTYKAHLGRSGGSSTATTTVSATGPGFLVVKDLGPS